MFASKIRLKICNPQETRHLASTHFVYATKPRGKRERAKVQTTKIVELEVPICFILSRAEKRQSNPLCGIEIQETKIASCCCRLGRII